MGKPEYEKRLIVYSEMIKAGRYPPRGSDSDNWLDELNMAKASPGGGCLWEFNIRLIELAGKGALQLQMFADSWEAFEEAPEVFEVLRMYAKEHGSDDRAVWPDLIADLEKVGWKREHAEPREGRKCRECGKSRD